MKKLVFVTNNQHKLQEVMVMLDNTFDICPLASIGCVDEISETGTTLQENAELKARFVYDRYGLDCFADDTGLEVDALHGEPGVYSARYAGLENNADRNIEKLLLRLQGCPNRQARFRTVIALIEKGIVRFFEGQVCGRIAMSRFGDGGFGYDSVFIPDGYEKTFAELPVEVKNNISHRSQAMRNLKSYLQSEIE